jgi:hypothetical protein
MDFFCPSALTVNDKIMNKDPSLFSPHPLETQVYPELEPFLSKELALVRMTHHPYTVETEKHRQAQAATSRKTDTSKVLTDFAAL